MLLGFDMSPRLLVVVFVFGLISTATDGRNDDGIPFALLPFFQRIFMKKIFFDVHFFSGVFFKDITVHLCQMFLWGISLVLLVLYSYLRYSTVRDLS